MLKSVMPTEEWSRVAPAYKRGSKQFYVLRIDPVENEGQTTSLEKVYDHEPTNEDEVALRASYLRICKMVKCASAVQYANTDAVKAFKIGNQIAWLNSETRVSLLNAFKAEQAAGRETTHLFLDGVDYELPIADAIALVNEVEVYAKDCYTATEAHKVAINALTDWREVEDYDYTTNYPEQPQFED